MKCKISFSLIIISCYIFLVVDDFNRLKDKFVFGIYFLFYTFVLFYVLTYIFFDKDWLLIIKSRPLRLSGVILLLYFSRIEERRARGQSYDDLEERRNYVQDEVDNVQDDEKAWGWRP